MKRITLFLLIFGMFLFGTAEARSKEYTYYEDFENFTLSSGVKNCTVEPVRDGKALKLVSDQSSSFVQSFATCDHVVYLGFDFMVNQLQDGAILRPISLFSDRGISAESRGLFFEVNNKTLLMRAQVEGRQTNIAILKNISENRMYHIAFAADFQTREIKVYVDSKRVCVNQKMEILGNNAENAAFIQITAGGTPGAELYIDNIRVLNFEDERLCALYFALSETLDNGLYGQYIGNYNLAYRERVENQLSQIRAFCKNGGDDPEQLILDGENLWHNVVKSRYLNVWYFEDFNNYPSNGQLPIGYQNTTLEYMGEQYGKSMSFQQKHSSYDEILPGISRFVLEFGKTTEVPLARINTGLPTTKSAVIEFDFFDEDVSAQKTVMTIIGENGSVELISRHEDDESWLEIRDCNFQYTSGEWTHVKLVLDFDNQKINIGETGQTADMGLSSLDEIILGGDQIENEFYIDNIGVYEKNELPIEVQEVYWLTADQKDTVIPVSGGVLQGVNFAINEDLTCESVVVIAAQYAADGSMKKCSISRANPQSKYAELNMQLDEVGSGDWFDVYFMTDFQQMEPLAEKSEL